MRQGVTYTQVLEFEIVTLLHQIAGNRRIVAVSRAITNHRAGFAKESHTRVGGYGSIILAETRCFEDCRCGVVGHKHVRIGLDQVHYVKAESTLKDH